MRQRYSRLESVEEKKNFRNAVILIILTMTVIAVLIVVGIPTLGKVANFVSGLRNSTVVSSSNDKTPPAPPTFRTYPDFTNQQTISLSGSAEPGTAIKLTFNESKTDALIDKDGNFSFQDLNLQNGENNFSAYAIDTAGNISQKSVGGKITYDNTPPNLTVDSPSDGSKFFGASQRQVTIQGTTDSGSSITINDRIVSVSDNGKFQYTLTLNSGDNIFNVKSVDMAGNSTEKNITLNFSE
ncbi:MAG TPA: Ig-like domain-containing protein [Patescibacteria group bacterium]|nr:Ig-like domain-containing protein [Patescibacteria group bacterium]